MLGNESVLILDVRPGDSIQVDGGRIIVELVHKSGKLARLRFVANKTVEIKLQKQDCEFTPSLA